MSEEKSESTGGSIKNIIIGLVSTITLGVGGWFTTKLTGGDEAAPVQQAAPVINITNSNQQSQAAGGKTVIIKEKETIKETAKPVKKKDGDEFKEEAPKW